MNGCIKKSMGYAFTLFTCICTIKYINTLNGLDGFVTFVLMLFASMLIGVLIVFIERVRMSKVQ